MLTCTHNSTLVKLRISYLQLTTEENKFPHDQRFWNVCFEQIENEFLLTILCKIYEKFRNKLYSSVNSFIANFKKSPTLRNLFILMDADNFGLYVSISLYVGFIL